MTETIIDCTRCPTKNCDKGLIEPEKLPSFCPMRLHPDLAKKTVKLCRENAETLRLFQAAASVEKEGYMRWPRFREIVELARRLGASKLGVAFCIGLSTEAKRVVNLLREWGFKVYAVCCKCGGIDKSEFGLGSEAKFDEFDAACNPILQAEILNLAGCQLNILVGLCVGHDALFTKHSKAPVTTLIAKDRITGHNPLIALYTFYHERMVKPSR